MREFLSIDADNGNNIVYTSVVYNRTCGYKYYNNYIVNDGTKYMSETGGKCYQMEMLEHQKQNVDEINKVYLETKKVRHEITKVIDMTQYLIENGQTRESGQLSE